MKTVVSRKSPAKGFNGEGRADSRVRVSADSLNSRLSGADHSYKVIRERVKLGIKESTLFDFGI